MRDKETIERWIKETKAIIKENVEDSVQYENDYEENQKTLNDDLKRLKEEIPFENSLRGIIQAHETETFANIDNIMHTLYEQTGKGYKVTIEEKEEEERDSSINSLEKSMKKDESRNGHDWNNLELKALNESLLNFIDLMAVKHRRTSLTISYKIQTFINDIIIAGGS